ncbi:iron ABC transporter substrate-binding protein [Shinella pollutisoli]|uniref:Iron ABC transporter substrate-binding protein n=1 Tax=Shinella pollutisoli TaxID=2250594 RepID=A0ABV7DCU3_9HYPH|nr:iron ABC transporter substrate-binding protein [Shinella pollutisoli]
MAVNTASGTKIFVGPATALSSIDWTTDETALANFEAIAEGSWKVVGEVEDFGEHGDSASDVTFTSVGDARVRHLKGARDAGTLALVVGDDPLDEGQIALIAAEKTNFLYAFRIEYADARDENHTDSVEYFLGLVMSRAKNVGTNDNVVRRTFSIGISSDIIEVLSEPISS